MDISTLNRTVNDAAGKAQKNEGLSVQSFVVSLAVYGGIFIPATYLFTFLKDSKIDFFQPRCQIDTDVLPLPRGRAVWIKHVWKLLRDDTELVNRFGFDCYFFLRLLQLAIKIFAPMAVLILPLLLAVNCLANSAQVGGLDRFSISNIQKDQCGRWWITAFASSLVNIHLWRLLLLEFKRLVEIRQAYLHKYSQTLGTTTILVTEIPPYMWNREKLESVYSAMNGGPVDITLPKIDICKAMEIDMATRYQDLANMKQTSPWASILRFDIRGFISRIIGEAILQWQIRRIQNDIDRTKSVALLHFSDPFTAHLVLQARASSTPMKLEAHNVDSNIVASDSIIYQSRALRTLWGAVITITLNFLAILWAVPISFTGLLSQLVYLESISPKLSGLSDYQLGAIQGLAPQVAVSILMYCFPIVLRFLTQFYLAFERLSIEVLLQRLYFIFLFTQLFIVVSISSSVTTMIPEIVNDVQSVPSVLAKNLPKASNYFYSYFLLQTITQTIMVLFQLPDSLWACVRQRWKKRNLRTVQWSLLYPVFTNLICICTVFSVISPLILLLGSVMFGVFLIIHSYQAVYVLETELDTAGMLYWEALNHLFVGIYTMDLFLIGLFILRNAFGPAAVATVLLAASALIQNHVQTNLRPLVKFMSASICG